MNPEDEKRFLDELIQSSEEIMGEIERLLLEVEADLEQGKGADPELVHTLFRHFHTIKGNSGFFQLTNIITLTHNAETLLNEVRNHKNNLTLTMTESLMASKDLLTKAFIGVAADGNDDKFREEIEAFIASLIQPKKKIDLDTELPEASFGIFTEPSKPIADSFGIFGETSKPEVESFATFPESQQSVEQKSDDLHTQPILVEKSTNISNNKKSDIRIHTEKLDLLIDTVGELVIAESFLAATLTNLENDSSRLKFASEELKKIITNLQDISLSLRMVPIESVFRKMERLVRDLSKKKAKKVNLVLKGLDTEVDKRILESLADPLVHLIRNAIDHGLETPTERLALHKPSTGKIELSAYNAGNVVTIEIKDDGRGLDREKILQKALEQGLLTNSENMSDNDIFHLIFSPGFSTSKELTDISGRGVGMDVVKQNIANLGGEVDLISQAGQGTTCILNIPLTLAIIDGTIIRNGQQDYIVPTTDVVETFDLQQMPIHELDDGNRNILFRGKIVPLVSLERFIGKQGCEKDTKGLYIIVLQAKGRYMGVIVDDITVNQSIVIKPLPALIDSVRMFSACTALGNGKIAFILDIKYLIDKLMSFMSHAN
ncbi:MAG: chemotaxis protein CheA [Spirochaetota bacterium]